MGWLRCIMTPLKVTGMFGLDLLQINLSLLPYLKYVVKFSDETYLNNK